MSGEVEFLGPGDPEPDPVPPGRRHTSRHTSRLAKLAAVAAVIAALAVWAVTRPDPSTPSARPHPTTAQPTRPAPDLTLALTCRSGAPLDNEIQSAMKHYFHGIAIRNLGVFRCVRGDGPNGRVLLQAVSGRYRGLNIDLEARLRTSHGVGPDVAPRLGAAHGRYQLLAQIKAISVNLDVTVNAYGPPGAAVPGDRMQRLCDFVSLNLVL